MKNQYIVFIALLIIFIAGISFFAGVKYQENKRNFSNFSNFPAARRGQFIQRQGIRPINGEIIEVEEQSFTVKLPDGSSKIVFLTDNTSINRSSAGSKNDLKKGEKILVFGTENSDGSMTAQNIQLDPQFGRMGGRSSTKNREID